jgi:hypothetical protein
VVSPGGSASTSTRAGALWAMFGWRCNTKTNILEPNTCVSLVLIGTKASLNWGFMSVSCTSNTAPRQQNFTFCMKLLGERRKEFHRSETFGHSRDVSGAGHAASPLGQLAPPASTNPQTSPHITSGFMRVSRSAHILPHTRPASHPPVAHPFAVRIYVAAPSPSQWEVLAPHRRHCLLPRRICLLPCRS